MEGYKKSSHARQMGRVDIVADLVGKVPSNLSSPRAVAITMSSNLKHGCTRVDASVSSQCHQGHCIAAWFRAQQSKKAADMGGGERASAGDVPFTAELCGDHVMARCGVDAGTACTLSILSHGDYAATR